MPLYTALGNPVAPPTPLDTANWPNTLGGRIKQRATGNVTNVLLSIGVKNLIGYFQNLGWTWNPGIAGRSPAIGRTWLDRVVAGAGECGYLGHALAILLTAPKPWGFEVPAHDVFVQVYSGHLLGAAANGDGFFADHAGMHHNLSANVCDPAAPAMLSPLRFWGDHVVVQYLNRFWDPSYNKSYNAIADMAHYRVVGDAFNPVAGYALEVRDLQIPAAANCWFRMMTPADHGFHPNCQWIGPYAANPIP